MKSLADLKRRLQVGARLELTYSSLPHSLVGVVRTIVSRNSVGVGFGPVGDSVEATWLNIFSGCDELTFFPDKHNSFALTWEDGNTMEYRIYD